jgi:hypothetical protein
MESLNGLMVVSSLFQALHLERGCSMVVVVAQVGATSSFSDIVRPLYGFVGSGAGVRWSARTTDGRPERSIDFAPFFESVVAHYLQHHFVAQTTTVPSLLPPTKSI